MDTTTHTGTPLRQRMIEDMRMRKLESRTQEGYIRAVRKLTVYLERSPDTATVEDLRNFQLHLVDAGTSPITLNATLTGLKFFFDITLGRGELMARMQPVKLPRTVPVVPSMQEAVALIAAARATSSIWRCCRWPTAPACASAKSAGSRSATSTASGWRCVSSKARAPRTATPC